METDLECIYCGKQQSDDKADYFYDFTCKECAKIIANGLKARHDLLVEQHIRPV